MPTATRKCCYCKDRKPREAMLLTPKGAFCDTSHAVQWIAERNKKMRQRKRSVADKERNENSLPHQLGLTRKAVNKLVRLLDQGKPCISCGEYRELEAGHFRSVGSMPSLQLDTRQIHGQCRPCNQSGTLRLRRGRKPELVRDGYERGIRERMGDACVDWIMGPHPTKHWSIEGLKRMRQTVNEEIRRLERGEKPVWDWRAWP